MEENPGGSKGGGQRERAASPAPGPGWDLLGGSGARGAGASSLCRAGAVPAPRPGGSGGRRPIGATAGLAVSSFPRWRRRKSAGVGTPRLGLPARHRASRARCGVRERTGRRRAGMGWGTARPLRAEESPWF
jgi:hypothetical protein